MQPREGEGSRRSERGGFEGDLQLLEEEAELCN